MHRIQLRKSAAKTGAVSLQISRFPYLFVFSLSTIVRMPWEGTRGPEYTADVRRFFELTRGHVILLGPRTYRCCLRLARR
jgi:hypothetical protein